MSEKGIIAAVGISCVLCCIGGVGWLVGLGFGWQAGVAMFLMITGAMGAVSLMEGMHK